MDEKITELQALTESALADKTSPVRDTKYFLVERISPLIRIVQTDQSILISIRLVCTGVTFSFAETRKIKLILFAQYISKFYLLYIYTTEPLLTTILRLLLFLSTSSLKITSWQRYIKI